MVTLRRSAAVLGLLLASAGPAWAHGGDPGLIHGCVQKMNGRVRIVAPSAACHPGESAVDWNRTGPQGPAGPPGPAGGAGLQVVDAGGTAVGPVVALELLNPVVLVRTGAFTFTLRFDGSRLQGYDAVYFDAPGCSGHPHVQRLGVALPTTAVDHTDRVYVDDGQSAVGVVTVASLAVPDGCFDFTFNIFGVPAVLALDLAAEFTPPFRVQ